jgi:hypothetical protein
MCTLCGYTVRDYHPKNFQKGPKPCAVCAGRGEARQAKLPALREQVTQGILRPRVFLYHEPNPDEDAIVRCLNSDLKRADAVVVMGTKLSISDLQCNTMTLCDHIHTRTKTGVAVWVSDEPPPARVAPKFDYIVRSKCDDFARLWLQSLLLKKPSKQQREKRQTARTGKQPVADQGTISPDTNLFSADDEPDGDDNALDILDASSTLDKCIHTISKWLSDTCNHYCEEENQLNAPFVYARPLAYANHKAYQNLKNHGSTNIAQGAIFGDCFRKATTSKRLVRIGVFTTCESNNIQIRQRQLLGSVWVLVLIKKKKSQRMAILLFDPKHPLCNDDGTYRSKTRKIANTREKAIDAYKGYAGVTKDMDIWHSKYAVQENHFQAVVDFLAGFVVEGDRALEDDDNRLVGFAKVQEEG